MKIENNIQNINNEDILMEGCENPFTLINNNTGFCEKDEYIILEKQNVIETQGKEENIKKNSFSLEKKETFFDSNEKYSEENQNNNNNTLLFPLDFPKNNNINKIIEKENNSKKTNIHKKKFFKIKTSKVNTCYYNGFDKKKGCISKLNKILGVKGKHDKYDWDNCIDKIFNGCKKSLNNTINLIFKDIDPNLLSLKINIKIDRNYLSYSEFCKNSIFNIYCKSFPKHKKISEKKMKGKDYEYNKSIINRAIIIDKLFGKKYKLDIFFHSTTFSLIMKAFLCDKTKIFVKNTILELKGFTTYQEWDGLNYLEIHKKEEIKNKLLIKLNLRRFKIFSDI